MTTKVNLGGMKTHHPLTLSFVVCLWIAGCGPAGLIFPDGSTLTGDAAEPDASDPDADPPRVDVAVSVDSTDPDAAELLDDASKISDDASSLEAAPDAEIPADAAEDTAREATVPDAAEDSAPTVDAGVDVATDSHPDAQEAGRDAVADTTPDVFTGCRTAADCDDGMTDTRDWCEAGGVCRHERCDDGNPCTANVGTASGCSFPVLPDGTTCRPGPTVYTCTGGVCPACGGENQVCCEWPGSTMVCQGSARCRTTAAGFRRCITCGHAGERCCLSSDGIMWASQRCDPGLSCSSITGVGTCG